MLRLKLAPVFVLVLGLLALAPVPAYAWRISQTAKSVCENGKAAIDWTFVNNESNRSIKVVVKDERSGQSQPARTLAAGQAASGTISTGQASISSGEISFLLKWADGEKGSDIRDEKYAKINCATKPATDTKPESPVQPTQPLPNTGPLDTFGPFAAFLLASGSSWLITRQELVKAAKQR